jgi:PPM family protein phosphatase
MTVAGRSDPGRVRARNEDSLALGPDQAFAIVCDGMGGHAGGDVASRIAATAVAGFLSAQADAGPLSDQAAAEVVTAAVDAANRRIHVLNREQGSDGVRAMGTTLVGAWMPPGRDRMVVFHVGDSRAYRLRKGRLAPLTRDHSLYQLWLDSGAGGSPPPRNTILRALGVDADIETDVRLEDVAAGDRVLLCSDGLTGMLDDSEIAAVLAMGGGLDAACGEMIARANAAGGSDNITVALLAFE